MAVSGKNLTFTLLTVAAGVFFLVTGVQDIINWNSSGAEIMRKMGQLFGSTQKSFLPLLLGILSLVSGAVLLLSPWGLLSSGLKNLALFLVFLYWAVKLVFDYFLFGSFTPDQLEWYRGLSLSLVVLTSLWILRSEA